MHHVKDRSAEGEERLYGRFCSVDIREERDLWSIPFR
jgi:hypothetical protein